MGNEVGKEAGPQSQSQPQPRTQPLQKPQQQPQPQSQPQPSRTSFNSQFLPKIQEFLYMTGRFNGKRMEEWIDKTYHDLVISITRTRFAPPSERHSKKEMLDSFEKAYAGQWRYSMIEITKVETESSSERICWNMISDVPHIKTKERIRLYFQVESLFSTKTGLWLTNNYDQFIPTEEMKTKALAQEKIQQKEFNEKQKAETRAAQQKATEEKEKKAREQEKKNLEAKEKKEKEKADKAENEARKKREEEEKKKAEAWMAEQKAELERKEKHLEEEKKKMEEWYRLKKEEEEKEAERRVKIQMEKQPKSDAEQQMEQRAKTDAELAQEKDQE